MGVAFFPRKAQIAVGLSVLLLFVIAIVSPLWLHGPPKAATAVANATSGADTSKIPRDKQSLMDELGQAEREFWPRLVGGFREFAEDVRITLGR